MMSRWGEEVTQLELSEFIGLSDRQLRNLRKIIPPKGRKGTTLVYDFKASVQAYVGYVQSAVESRITDKDVEDARRRTALANAAKEEAFARVALLDAAHKEGQVALIDDVRHFVEKNNERVKSKLLSQIPGKAAQLVGLKRVEDAQARLIEMCNNTLGELAEWSDPEVRSLDDPEAP